MRSRIRTAWRGARPLDAVGWLARQKHAAQAHSLFLQAVEQTPRPHEFGGEHSKRQENRQPAGSRRDNHDDSDRKQREAEENFQPPLGLL